MARAQTPGFSPDGLAHVLVLGLSAIAGETPKQEALIGTEAYAAQAFAVD